MPVRRGLLAALLLAAAARGDEEPTPFWMPPPAPTKRATAKPVKKPVQRKPVQIGPLEIKRKERPPVVEKRQAPAPREPPSMEPSWIDPAPPAAAPAPRASERLPEPTPKAGERTPEPVPWPKQAPVEIEPSALLPRAPAARAPAPPVATLPPAAVELAPPAAVAMPAPGQPAAAVLAEPEPEPPVDTLRRWSLGAAFGAWGKSRSDGTGRDWQVAYGLRLGRAIFPALELELELLRAGGTAGSPFVNASATHNLAMLRAFWVLGGQAALLLGGGAGAALAQTHYALQPSTDPGVAATGLDANAVKSVIQITAAVRARIFRGLEARAEVSAAARDGKLELLPLLGAGAAF